MQHSALGDVSKPQQERLAFIEFRLLFLGSVNRPDLVRRFGISESAASRDFALYRQLVPANILYSRSNAVYLPGTAFEPLYHYSAGQVLTALAEGFGDDFVATPASWLPCEMPSRLNEPSVDILVPVSRALFSGKALQIDYRSLSRGLTRKTIVPLVLVDNGLRWHLRAYEPAQNRYADFVLNRIEQAELGERAETLEKLRQSDIEWQQQIELELAPHPMLAHPETIAFEYCMDNNVLRVSVRSALAGYLLRRWNVDCSPEHSLKGPEYLLWLRNAKHLSEQHNLIIAPGFMDVSQAKTHGGKEC